MSATTNSQTGSFDSLTQTIYIASGRCVGVGHEVVNFGVRAVVVGFRKLNGRTWPTLQEPAQGFGMIPGTWEGDPAKCI